MKNNNYLRNDLSIVDSIIYKLEPEFVNKLSSEYTKLTEDEIKICVLIKNNFSNEEIARFMFLLEDEVSSAMNIINRKLKRNYNQSIMSLLKNLT